MKTITDIIGESKIENIMVPEWDVKPYVDIMLDKWLQSINSVSILNIQDNYSKIELLRKCEVVIYILDKFSDDLSIHFITADKKVDDKQKIYYGYSLADRLISVFNVIMKIMEIDSKNPNAGLKKGESIADEVSDLKSRFTKLIDKYNTKYNERIEKAKKANAKEIAPVPCDCECCCGCAC